MALEPVEPSDAAPFEAWPTAPVTRRQWEIFNWMVEFTAANLYQPSVREIGQRFEIRSVKGVYCHLKALSAKGLIERPRPGQGRALNFRRRSQLPESAMTDSPLVFQTAKG